MFAARVVQKWVGATLALALAVGGSLVGASAAVAAPTPQTCNYAAAGQGAYARTLCWVDMTGYSDAAAGAGNGQAMVLNLSGGYTMTYSIQRSGRQISSSPFPLIPSAFIGSAGHYGGVSGRPGLYQVNRAVDPATSSTLRMTDITMRDANGNQVTAFSIVGVDVEQTTTGETDTWTSNVPMTQLTPIGNACPQTFSGVGTTTVVCASDNTLNRTGTAMLAAENPSFMTQRMQNATQGVQGVAFAVLLPKVQLKKIVDGRIDPLDSFALSVSPQGGAAIATGDTGTTSSATTGEVETIGAVANAPFTLAETTSPGSLSGYVTSWACTKNGFADPSLPNGQAGDSVTVSPAIGDLIDCTVTNTARPVGLTLQKSAGQPVDVNGNWITDAGDTIGYSFVVKNTGELAMDNVVVDDPVIGAVTCPVGVLLPGATRVCAGATDYTVTAADAERGFVLNLAVATATPSGSNATITSNTSSTTTPTEVAAPMLELVKSASVQSLSLAGDYYTYAYTVRNTGNVPISGISIAEDVFTGTGTPPSAVCPSNTLAPTLEMTCTAEYIATQADIDRGSVLNSATANGVAGGEVASGQSSVEIPVVASPSLELSKSVEPSDTASFVVGQGVSYTFVLTNSGNVTLSNLSVEERVFTGSGPIDPIACGPEAASLPPGHHLVCHANYVLTQQDLDAGTVKNSAVAHGATPSGGPVDSGEAIAELPADQAPSLSLEKSADPSTVTAAGQSIEYRFVATNTGNVTLNTITVSETQFSGAGVAPTVACPAQASSLLPGESVICTATYVSTLTDVDAGVITNTAVASALGQGGASVDSLPSSATVIANPLRSVSLLKTAAPAKADQSGESITYSYVITNTGTVTLSDVGITESSFSGTGAAPVVSCPAGAQSLAPSASVTCTAAYEATQPDIDAGQITNTATAHGTAPAGGGQVNSEPSTALVTAAPVPNLTVIKTADVYSVSAVGDPIEYSFTVTNTGNVTLSDVRIVEGVFTGVGAPSPPACPSPALAPGATMICTSTVEVQQRDLDAGMVSNTASASGIPPAGGDPVLSPPSTVHIPTVVSPAVSLTKSVSPTSIAAAGDAVRYSFEVTNVGNVTLSDVEVVEASFAGNGTPPVVSCPAAAASLAPADSVICTADYVATQSDVDLGSVSNVAVAVGTPPGAAEGILSPESEATFTSVIAPALAVAKTADAPEYGTGDHVGYTFVVTNTGNATLTAIVINEVAFSGSGPIPVAACPVGVALAPGETLTCSATYDATGLDVANGHLDNVATASGTTSGIVRSPVVSDPSSAVVTAGPPSGGAALTLTKFVDPVKLATFAAGEVLKYRFVVANTGSEPIENILVEETVFTGRGVAPTPTCPADLPVLVPGASVVCTATYVLTDADSGARQIANTAIAHGADANGDPVDSFDSTATVTVPPAVALTGASVTWIAAFAALLTLAGLACLALRRRNAVMSSPPRTPQQGTPASPRGRPQQL
ncbi:DUF7507 domain-containing protein [Lysinibacter cavernae]|uniref:Putative repeat protein (TIGR01451 family) n=1 Tax=Lysinibacter cavernae TaxID=1640652 RepID=A0A7X5R2X1_9MICO|nr:hypothetical protein [Lysinibacter cavernae]NIH54395.1 putative repeat protein (TIGR01451 family) [Lysinibacter cavernae]